MKYDIDSIKKRKKINNNLKKLIYVFIIIMLYNIILLFMSYIDKFETPEIYTYKAYIIATDSMFPEIRAGDIVIIKRCQEQDLKKGSIVTFKQAGEVITHRIIDIVQTEQGKEYTTKGDNNNVEDARKIKYDEIEGVKVMRIPFLGKIMSILKSGIIVILAILLFLILLLNRATKEEKSKNRREKKRIEDKKSII